MRKPKATDFDDLSGRVAELARYVRLLIPPPDSYLDNASLAILAKMNALNIRYDLDEKEIKKLEERDSGKAEQAS